ncbi:alpha/beta fold hydrolase [Streptomyces sp. NPDC005248]|uniref:alpha/beta fold hydrolase n=1 Tax=Streptomyces sp. NPDC005248 TaxID=3364709 RepID=UPI00368CA913
MTAADAVPIVFVHGTRLSAGQWSMQLAALQDEFPVVAIDLPGHGERSAQPWSLSTSTEIIASAVDSLDRGPALVVGHSLGGYASLAFARRRPEHLRGLILAGASAGTRGPSGHGLEGRWPASELRTAPTAPIRTLSSAPARRTSPAPIRMPASN